MEMYPVQTDEVFFVFITGFVFSTPAVISAFWAYFTKQSRVRKKLNITSALLILYPIFSAGLYALLQTRCLVGHIDERFSQCRYIPDIWARNMFPISAAVTLLPAALLAGLSLVQEVRGWRNHLR
ncbi:hypothetical protein [Tropicibacter sp. S64]|uniref:hypothetical protein n=1 Tax=Tropicibacter sp. S64 TaxID=3415122 RepID=UPI003C7D2382